MLLEIRSRFKEADAIYLKGISRNAAPLERLKRKYESFQHRMMIPQKRVEEEEDIAEEIVVQRSVLAPSTAPAPQRRVPPPPPTAAPMPTSAYSSYGSMKPVPKSQSNNIPAPSKLAVFKDDSSSAPAAESRQPWSDFGTRDSQLKENTIQPEPWKGTKMPQNDTGSRGQPRLNVYIDSESSSSSSTTSSREVDIEYLGRFQSLRYYISQRTKNLLSNQRDCENDAPLYPVRSKTPPGVLCFKFDFLISENDQSINESSPVQDKSPANPFHSNTEENSTVESSSPNHFDSSDEDEDAEADRELERLTRLNTVGNNHAHESSDMNLGFAALADVYEMFNAKLPSEELDQHQSKQGAREYMDDEDDDDDGDEVVAVKNGLDDKPEWYEIEADETISRKVIKPQSSGLKSAVFVDDSESVVAPKVSIFNDENSCSTNTAPKKARKPLGVKEVPPVPPKPTTPVVDVQSPFFHDENSISSSNIRDHQASPSISLLSRNASERTHAAPSNAANVKPKSSATLSKALAAAPNLHSTPFHQQQQPHFLDDEHPSSTLEDDEPSDYEEKLEKPRTQHYYKLHQHHKDLMTPITEASFEYDRTLGGLSTIGSVRYDDFTTSTLGRASGVTGVLRESLVGGLASTRRDAPNTVLPKKHYSGAVSGGDGFVDGSGMSLSSISMASTTGALSSVDVSGSCSVGNSLEAHQVESYGVLAHDEQVGGEDEKDDGGLGSVMMLAGNVSVLQQTQENVGNEVNENMEIPNPCNPCTPSLQQHFMTMTDNPTALKNAPDGGIFQTQFGPHTFVRFRVVKCLNTDKKTGSVKYLARELKSGLFAQSALKDEEQELEDDDEEDEDPEDDEDCDDALVSMETPGSSWEFYALKSLRARLADRILDSIPNPVSCHMFVDSSCMRTDFCSEMTIMDAIKLSSKPNEEQEGEEVLKSCWQQFWTVEIMRTLEAIHVSGFLHGNVSPESILVRLGRAKTMTGAAGYWDAQYDPSGCGGKAVDLFAFPENQSFVVARVVWCCQCIAFYAFGKEIRVVYEDDEGVRSRRPRGRITGSSFKRSWQVEMWERLFDVLINLENAECAAGFLEEAARTVVGKDEEFEEFAGEFPPALSIRACRMELEQWLVASCSKAGKSLKSILQRVEMASLL
ncbi:hypothetical protein BDR26DRAFT_851406 [Obelidium mucronatum]|nr:hypothetical protein BDR26DRAFT_851406 [Obelidium mucronatum]